MPYDQVVYSNDWYPNLYWFYFTLLFCAFCLLVLVNMLRNLRDDMRAVRKLLERESSIPSSD